MSRKPPPSSRHFGFLVAAAFVFLAIYSFYRDANSTIIYGWLFIGVFVGIVGLVAPKLLTPFNSAWMWLGNQMGKIVAPLVLGFIFFLLISPIALLTRFFGRDELRLCSMKKHSYWVDRVPPGPTGDSFKNQF